VRGESVPMLVHHSRNSAQKQWDETLVLALGGMGRLLRAHLPLLSRMPAFPQARRPAPCRAHQCPHPGGPAGHAAPAVPSQEV